jgi:uncharacterized protein (TIGR02246 family)
MRILAVVAFCYVIVGVPPALAQGSATAADETAVRAVVAKYVDAREKRDPKLLEVLFTADADQLTTTGEWRQGRDNVVRGGLASSQANPGSRQITIETVRFVATGVAIADGRYEITEAQNTAPRRMRTTFVVVRAGSSEWRIAAIRNMAPTEPAR